MDMTCKGRSVEGSGVRVVEGGREDKEEFESNPFAERNEYELGLMATLLSEVFLLQQRSKMLWEHMFCW